MADAKTTWEIKDRFIMCRLRGHHWILQKRKGWLVLDEDGFLVWRYACEDCETEKHQRIRYRTGEIKPASSNYPKGYLFHLEGRERPSRAEVRLGCVRSLTVGATISNGKKAS